MNIRFGLVIFTFMLFKKTSNSKVGNYVFATKIRNILCDLYRRKVDNKFFFVENMRKNLLSLTAITDNGNKVVISGDTANISNKCNLIFSSKKTKNYVECFEDKTFFEQCFSKIGKF